MSDINDVIGKINACGTLSEIPTKDFLDAETGYAHIVAKNSKKLNTTQLRKFFAALKKLEQKDTWDEIETEFYLLKPRMAVSVGRKNLPKTYWLYFPSMFIAWHQFVCLCHCLHDCTWSSRIGSTSRYW